jgi:hypothetical protein
MKEKPSPKTKRRAKNSVPGEDTSRVVYMVMREVIKTSESI